MKIIAVIPVHGRLPLVKFTVTRLQKRNGVFMVICVGFSPEEQTLCTGLRAAFIRHKNEPLGAKWNAGFKFARKYNPDAILFVGSSDWLTDNWLPEMTKYLPQFDLIGKLDTHFIDYRPEYGYRGFWWPGYERTNPRSGEPIGIGRIISRRILEKMDWSPFDPTMNFSMDFQMMNNVYKHGGRMIVVENADIKSLSISCNQWINKHNFERESKMPGVIKIERLQQFIDKDFPELYRIFGNYENSGSR